MWSFVGRLRLLFSSTSEGKREIPLGKIDPNPFHPRQESDPQKLQELADSIREIGVLQPVVVRKVGGRFQLVAGHRRVKASELIGRKTIPAIVRELSDADMLAVCYLENVGRQDLELLEEARSYERLWEEHKPLSLEEMARKIGKDPSEVLDKLSFLQLPLAIQQALVMGVVGKEHAKDLSELLTEHQELKKVREMFLVDLPAREIAEYVRMALKSVNGNSKRDLAALLIKEIRIALYEAGVPVEKSRGEASVALVHAD